MAKDFYQSKNADSHEGLQHELVKAGFDGTLERKVSCGGGQRHAYNFGRRRSLQIIPHHLLPRMVNEKIDKGTDSYNQELALLLNRVPSNLSTLFSHSRNQIK